MTVSKPSVYVLDPYHPDAIKALEQSPDITAILPTDPAKNTYPENAIAIMLRSETRLGAAELSQCKSLNFIVKQGVGVDNIDLKAAAEHGIKVYNTPGLNGEAVAEHTLALALTLARRVAEIDRRTRGGEVVVRSQTLGKSLYEKTLGVVGMGNIGFAVAKKWVGAMEGNIIAYDPFSDGKHWRNTFGEGFTQVSSLHDLLKASDVVTLHIPLTSTTTNSISTTEFEVMKDGAILLNCSRGGIVDEDALLVALKSGKLFGAGLDAMVTEPPTLEAYPELLALSNVVVTPHVGASTMENQSQSGRAVVDVVLGLLRGEEKGCRLRKVRCDGGQPVCGICIAYGETCDYDRPPPMTQIRAMADRIAELEETVKKLTNNAGAVTAEQSRSRPIEPLPPIENTDQSLDEPTYYDTTSALHGPGDTPLQQNAVESPANRPLQALPIEMLESPDLDFWENEAISSASIYLNIPQEVIRRLFTTHWTWVHANFIPLSTFNSIQRTTLNGESTCESEVAV
ncbi:unnamed protein product [Fusarium equiseti]|uniref:Zn(2)-C6 fungal-type domain-containing protein n=1 Tax=Fusarium equiseti TaxID=61235 RepID=A0A8J2J530_FUSEQ|nr:unnamed protein product [Fusarium equiseti]